MLNPMMNRHSTPKSATCSRSARLLVSDSKTLILYSNSYAILKFLFAADHQKNCTQFPSKGDCGVFPSYKFPS